MMIKMSQLATGLTLALFAAVLAGCSGPAKSVDSTPQQAIPESSDKSVQPAESEPSRLAGKVVETMNAGGYTYILLENKGMRLWAAVPTMKVSTGEEVEVQPGMVMTNFTSKALNRTFKSIIFSEGPVQKR
jgi:starvation-inducible outer membrane lipoprotein